jgi:hypothetical protein
MKKRCVIYDYFAPTHQHTCSKPYINFHNILLTLETIELEILKGKDLTNGS